MTYPTNVSQVEYTTPCSVPLPPTPEEERIMAYPTVVSQVESTAPCTVPLPSTPEEERTMTYPVAVSQAEYTVPSDVPLPPTPDEERSMTYPTPLSSGDLHTQNESSVGPEMATPSLSTPSLTSPADGTLGYSLGSPCPSVPPPSIQDSHSGSNQGLSPTVCLQGSLMTKELSKELRDVDVVHPRKVVLSHVLEWAAKAEHVQAVAGTFGVVEACYIRSRDGFDSYTAVVVFSDEMTAKEFLDKAVSGELADSLGPQMRAAFGTARYCHRFLKGCRCRDSGCMDLHQLVHPIKVN